MGSQVSAASVAAVSDFVRKLVTNSLYIVSDCFSLMLLYNSIELSTNENMRAKNCQCNKDKY